MLCGIICELAGYVLGLLWTPSPRYTAETNPNLSQLYLSWLSLAKPAKLNFFKTPASELTCSDLKYGGMGGTV